MKDALAATMTALLEQQGRTLTWTVARSEPSTRSSRSTPGSRSTSPTPTPRGQRATNENHNGLLRQYSEGHRSVPLDCRGDPGRRNSDQQQAPEGPRMEDPSRSPR